MKQHLIIVGYIFLTSALFGFLLKNYSLASLYLVASLGLFLRVFIDSKKGGAKQNDI